MAGNLMGLTVKATDAFFDKPGIIARIDKTRLKNLSRAGAFVRTSARSLLRRRKNPSRPGQPPTVYSRDNFATLRNILFAYDETGDEGRVIVGPVGLNQVNDVAGSRQTIPELLEKGGTNSILEVSANRGKTWKRFDRRRNIRPWEITRRRPARYEPRPFMGPALAKEQKKIMALWRFRV